jgi:hypothetical protein
MRTYTPEVLAVEKRMREEKILRKWRDMQSKGKARFLLFNGVLAYGGCAFLFMALASGAEVRHWPSLSYLGSLLGLGALVGLFYGWSTWHIQEVRCNRLNISHRDV